jgi:outer membrane biosynthesis protein TonB
LRGKEKVMLDKEKVKDRLTRLKTETEFAFFKPHKGTNLIRVLPAWNEEGIPYKECALHYNVGERAYACPKQVGGECPICDFIDQLRKTGQADDLKLVKELNASKRIYWNVIDKENEAAGIQIYACGRMVFKDILSIMADPDYEDIIDPQSGYDLKIEVSGEGLKTEYSVRPAAKPSVVEFDPAALNNLDQLVNIHTVAFLSAALAGEELPDEPFNAGDPNYQPPTEEPVQEETPAEETVTEEAPAEEQPVVEETPQEEVAVESEPTPPAPVRKPVARVPVAAKPTQTPVRTPVATSAPAVVKVYGARTPTTKTVVQKAPTPVAKVVPKTGVQAVQDQINSTLERLRKIKAKGTAGGQT